jgi:hypothetical protein
MGRRGLLLIVSSKRLLVSGGLSVLVSGRKSGVINDLGIFYGLHEVGRFSKSNFSSCLGLQAFDEEVKQGRILHLNFKL